MAWVEWVWCVIWFTATARALATAWRKDGEAGLPADAAEEERLYVREDTVHWWMATVLNFIMLGVGIVALLTPNVVDLTPTWQETSLVYGLLAFSVLLLARIEVHGWFYRRRNNIDIFGRPRP